MKNSNEVIEGEFEVLREEFFEISGMMGDAPDEPEEYDDTLKSRQTLRALFAISEGPISSVDEIYINKTLSTGYKKVTIEQRPGNTTQDVISGFDNIVAPAPTNASVQLSSGTGIIKTVSSTDIDALRLTFQTPVFQLRTSKGDIVGNEVQYKVERRATAGDSWTLYKTYKLSGKASSAYAWDIRIPRPTDPSNEALNTLWQVRVTRVSPDDPDSKSQSVIVWSSTMEIIEEKRTYPNTALVGFTFANAKRLGGSMPEITMRGKGLMLKVPVSYVYNAAARTYSGTPWDGTFSVALQHTRNPAWMIYALLTNTRWGLKIPEAEVNRFAFFQLAQYCDGILTYTENGQNISEHRYSMDVQITEREQAANILMYFLTICNAQLINDEFGNVSIDWDQPKEPTKLLNNSNVIEGVFEYSSSPLEERYTTVNITYNDVNNFGETETVTETDSALEARYGHVPIDIPLTGCYSQAQARRKARWVLYTNGYLTNIITFKVLFQGLTFTVGEVIAVMDDVNQRVLQQGILKGGVNDYGHAILLCDREIEASGITHCFYYADSGVVNAQVLSISEHRVTVASSQVPIEASPYLLSGGTAVNLFKVAKVSYDSESKIHTIVALQYDPGKFSYVETGIFTTKPIGINVNIQNLQPNPVTNIQFQEHFFNDGINKFANITVTWDHVSHANQPAIFDIYWRRDSLNYVHKNTAEVHGYDIENAVPGVYEVIVYAFYGGFRSEGTYGIYNYKVGVSGSTLEPPTNIYVKGTTGTQFLHKEIPIVWKNNPNNVNKSDVLRDYVVEVWDQTFTNLLNTYIVEPLANTDGEWLYTFEMNLHDNAGTARRNVKLKFLARDIGGKLSIPVAVTFSNPAPAIPNWNVIFGLDCAYFNITPDANDPDIAGIIIWWATTSGFVPSNANRVFIGPDLAPSISPIEENVTYYVRVAAYDTFGTDDLNISGELVKMSLGLNVITWTFSGLSFKPNDPSEDYVSWTAGYGYDSDGNSYYIPAGNVRWTHDIVYLYFKPILGTPNGVILGTTVFGIAIDDGTRILATYEGGTKLVVGNGDAFISGDKLMAGVVGAEHLVADRAVITGTAQIAEAIIANYHLGNGIIDTAKIANILQSVNWDTWTLPGWRIDKNGWIHIRGGGIMILDDEGQILMNNGKITARAIDAQLITADKIVSNSLSNLFTRTQNFPVTISPNTLPQTLDTFTFTSPRAANTWVCLAISVSMTTPLAADFITLTVGTSVNTLFYRTNNTLEARHFSATHMVKVQVPANQQFSLVLKASHQASGSAFFDDFRWQVLEYYA